MKKSLLYILFEAIAKGGPQVFLLMVVAQTASYDNLLLFISLEGLLALLFCSNYVEVIYSLNDKYAPKKVLDTIFSANLISLLFLGLIALIGYPWIAEHYEYDNPLTYILIILVSFFIITYRFTVVKHQVNEDHNTALTLKFVPFMLSFLFSMAGYLLIEDEFLGYYLGKAGGFTIAFIVFINKLKFKFFQFDMNILKDYLSRIKRLIIIYVTGWLSGYGYLNIVKDSVDEATLSEMGYVLNLFTIFLLVSNGINQVFVPKLRKIYLNENTKALGFANKFHVLYFAVAGIALLVYKGVANFVDIEIVQKYVSYFCWACLIFVMASFDYVSKPFYMIVDKYNRFMIINILSNVLGFSLLIFAIFVLQSKEIIYIYICFNGIKFLTPYLDVRINRKSVFGK